MTADTGVVTFYWHNGTVYGPDAKVLKRNTGWDEAQANAQVAQAFTNLVAPGTSVRILKMEPPR